MITEKGLLEESYEIIKMLCDGMMDMPSGCDGCPLCDEIKCDKEIWEEQYKQLRKGVQE